MWVGAVVQLVEYRTRNQEVAGSTHTRSTASNLEQVANLLCAQANSASYPQRDGKWVVATATRWRPSVADWGDVCLLAAPWVQLSVSAGNGWPHNALRHHWLLPISCHFRDCKALLVTSLTHVSGAIASVQTFTFTFTYVSYLISLLRPSTWNNGVNLKSGSEATQAHWKWYHSKAWYGFLSHSTAIMAVSLAVLTQYTNVTDRHTDTQPDTARQYRPRLCIL